jgi:6-pyruvoyltetrahydropterin/6-carboxytetrahydropterin synthase
VTSGRTQSIWIRHNAEIAHRLAFGPKKCQQIHGHSLQIKLTLFGVPDENGMLNGMDFRAIKQTFRNYIDADYDHHLLLNQNDPMLKHLRDLLNDEADSFYPGAIGTPGEPTTENMARWLWEWSEDTFTLPTHVEITETNSNGATAGRAYGV